MDPQACSRCNSLPEDILMLACTHDLCLNCASNRLADEMKRKKNSNVLLILFRVFNASSVMRKPLLMNKALFN